MNLRELKKEVEDLPSIQQSIARFQKDWIKTIKKNSNEHLPFLQDLPDNARKEVNEKLISMQRSIKEMEDYQITQKLRHYARYLIELKLTTLNGDKNKAQLVTDRLLNDEFLNIKSTINDVKEFGLAIRAVAKDYHRVLEILQDHISLDESVEFMGMSHKTSLNNLVKMSQKQKDLVRELGNNFITLARKTGVSLDKQ